MTDTAPPPWRVGRTVGRTIYDADDQLIGVMDTPGLASAVVAAINLLTVTNRAALDEDVAAEDAADS